MVGRKSPNKFGGRISYLESNSGRADGLSRLRHHEFVGGLPQNLARRAKALRRERGQRR